MAENLDTPKRVLKVVGGDTITEYDVNPAAENAVNTVARVILVLGIIIGFVLFLGGLGYIGKNEPIIVCGMMLAAMIVVILAIVLWAFLKVLVNISRNLYNINSNINNLQFIQTSLLAQDDRPDSSDTPLAEQEKPKKFAVGQLVIIKDDQRQFRIGSVSIKDGKYFYWSEKLKKKFAEEEIEDFDEYWAEKEDK